MSSSAPTLRMGLMAMAVLAFVLTTCLMSSAESAPCPLDTVEISITSTADVRNLTHVLDCVGQGVFNVTWHSNLTIHKAIEVSDGNNVTVTGNALDGANTAGVIIDAGSGTGIFSVSDRSTLSLNNIGLEGGNAEDGGAVAVISSSTLNVFGCTFTYNNASNGGALFSSDSSIYVDGSTLFGGNSALYGGSSLEVGTSSTSTYGEHVTSITPTTSSGGAIYADNASVVNITGDTSFADNLAYFQGGAIYAEYSTIRLDGKTNFSNNLAQGAISTTQDAFGTGTEPSAKGGVIYAQTSDVGIDGDATFTNNSATDDGGAIYANSSRIGIHGNASFTSNSAGVHGGVIFAKASDVGINGSATFTLNSAKKDGGVIFVRSSCVSISGNAMFTNNSAEGGGGVIFSYSSDIGIDGTASFTSNLARYGGAIRVYELELSIDGSATFTSNSARFSGGAVHVSRSELGIDGNALFSHNSAGTRGGAVYASTTSTLGIDGNAKFTHNSADRDGGAIFELNSRLGIDGNAMFIHNSADGHGGAICASWSGLGIDGNALFSHHSADGHGGAVYAFHSNLDIDGNANFTHNSAGFEGGAVHASSSELDIDGNAMFTHNLAGTNGGAVYASSSELDIDGNASFTHNSASIDGGAICLYLGNFTISSGEIHRGGLSGDEGRLYSIAGADYSSDWSVAFVSNSAAGLGGAIQFVQCDQVQVDNTMFKSNKASFGGAVYIVAVSNKQTSFDECVFEGNTAEDGGALYLNTGPGVDIFNASVFRSNFASTSGGAIFHTGYMHVSDTSFVANKAEVEGPAVMSIGLLNVMYNVNFSENAYYCPAGEYGYIEKNEARFCSSCFEEVCSRCSNVGDAVSIRQEIGMDGKPVCAEPPVGATAPVPGTTIANLTLQNGYFRTSNESHDIRQCYQKRACQGGNDTDKYCTSGYTGPYCAVCVEDFAPGIAYSCRECSGNITRSAVALAVAVGLAVLLFAGAMLSYLGKVEHDRAEVEIEMDQMLWKKIFRSCRAPMVNMLPVRAIKITVTVWQIISQFDAIAGDVYPDLYQTFVSRINPINVDLEFVFSYSCLVRNDFYDHLVFATITPLVALVILAASYFIGKMRNRCSVSAMREVRHKHQAVVLFTAFLVYSPVSYRIFQTFGCDKLDDGTTYLRADYSLSCSTSRHSWYRVYAFVMVAVYPFGITAAVAGLLIWHRRDLVKSNRGTMLHLKPLNVMWAAYKPSRYYYEVIECGRRISLTVIAAFIFPNSAAQISTALLFAVVYVFISEVLSPFQKGIDTVLYRWGNGIVVASMYVAFLTKIDFKEDTASAEYLLTFSGVLIAANMFMAITVLIQTVLLAKQMCAMNNEVRVSDIPVRRTHSVSWGGLRPIPEGDVCGDWGEALESKDCDM